MGVATAGRGKTKGKPSKAFPPEYKRRSYTRKLEWLRGEECGNFVKAGLLQFNQVVAEQHRLEKHRVAILQIVPSSTCADDWQGGQNFPPPSEHTPMRLALRVLCKSEIPVMWPAAYLRGGETYDVVIYKDLVRRSGIEGRRINHGTTESPTRIAVDELERTHTEVKKRRLVTCDTHALRAQIADYESGRSSRILSDD